MWHNNYVRCAALNKKKIILKIKTNLFFENVIFSFFKSIWEYLRLFKKSEQPRVLEQ